MGVWGDWAATCTFAAPFVTRRVAGFLAAVSAADVVFGSYRRGGYFEPAVMRVLPLDPALLAGSERRSAPLHHLAPDALLERLASEYLFAAITRSTRASTAGSEMPARSWR